MDSGLDNRFNRPKLPFFIIQRERVFLFCAKKQEGQNIIIIKKKKKKADGPQSNELGGKTVVT